MPAENSTPPHFSALLVAGGRSRRMGQDKALLEWQGRPLWRVQAKKLLSLKPARMIVACREEQGLHETEPFVPEIEWLFDPPGEDLGPISAIARALDGLTTPLLALAVDMPWMTADFLRNHLLGESRCVFYQGSHGYEPLAGLYGPAMRSVLRDAMHRGQLGLQGVIETAASSGIAVVRPIPAEAESLFLNANTQAEWNAAAPQG